MVEQVEILQNIKKKAEKAWLRGHIQHEIAKILKDSPENKGFTSSEIFLMKEIAGSFMSRAVMNSGTPALGVVGLFLADKREKVARERLNALIEMVQNRCKNAA